MGVVAEELEKARVLMRELLDSDPDLGKPENWQVLQDTVEGETNTMDLARWFAAKKIELEDELKDRRAIIERRKKDLEERQARAEALANRVGKLTEIAYALAQAATPPNQKVTIKAPGITAYTQTQSDKQRALVEVNPGETPPEYVKETIRVPDKQAIKEALVNKREVPGWTLANAKSTFVIRAL
jgi:hypothetical protein